MFRVTRPARLKNSHRPSHLNPNLNSLSSSIGKRNIVLMGYPTAVSLFSSGFWMVTITSMAYTALYSFIKLLPRLPLPDSKQAAKFLVNFGGMVLQEVSEQVPDFDRNIAKYLDESTNVSKFLQDIFMGSLKSVSVELQQLLPDYTPVLKRAALIFVAMQAAISIIIGLIIALLLDNRKKKD